MAAAVMPQLQAAISELSTLLLSSAPTVLTAFDAAAQEHLARNDELMALVDSARLEIQHTTDVAFANLLTQTQVRPSPPFFIHREAPPSTRAPAALTPPTHTHATPTNNWAGAAGAVCSD